MGDAIATSAVQRSDRTRDERQREASAQAERGAKMLRPVQSGSIGTEFGVAGRMWSSGYHTGVDFRVGTGTPIRAAQTGRVVETTSSGPYGNSIVIDHGNGIRTRYAHQSKLLVGKGDVVQAGERIGLSGATGNVTGPHLHFEVLKNGKTVAPGPYLSGQRTL